MNRASALGETETSNEAVAQDVRLPTRGMLVVGGFVLAISIAAFFRVPLLPSVGAELSMSAAQLGLLTTVFGAGRLATDIPAGRLADRLSPVAMLGIAGAALGIGSTAFGLAPTSTWAIAAAFVLGIASATANTSGMTYFSTAAPRHQRGMAMAGFSAALLGGQAIGPALGGGLGDAIGWRSTMVAAGVTGGAVALYSLWSNRTAATPRGEASDDDPMTAPPSADPDRERAALRQRVILYAVPFSFFYTMSALPQTLVPILGDERYALSASAIGLALGLGGVCRLIGSFTGGAIADRVSRKASLVPGLVLFAVGAGSFAVDLGEWWWVVGIVLLSLGSYGISVSATMLADVARGRGVGRRLGAFRFVGDIGLIVGPVVTASLYERLGAEIAAGLVAALLLVVTVVAAVFLDETHTNTRSAT